MSINNLHDDLLRMIITILHSDESALNFVCVNKKMLSLGLEYIMNRTYTETLQVLISRPAKLLYVSEIYFHKIQLDKEIHIPRFGDEMIGFYIDNSNQFKIGYYIIHYIENFSPPPLFNECIDQIRWIRSNQRKKFVKMNCRFIGHPFEELYLISEKPLTIIIKYKLWDNNSRKWMVSHPYENTFLNY